MGINGLTKFLKRYAPNALKEVDSDSLAGTKIAFDTSILIYQFVIAIRSTANDLVDENGNSTSHIHASIMKTKSFLSKKICPIYVFDGKPPQIKMDTLGKRSKIRDDAVNALSDQNLTEEDKIKFLKQSVRISGAQMEECKEILRLMGIPVIESVEEADPQCAYLSKNDYVDAVASEDMDLLTFGTKVLLRNMTKKKILKIELEEILKELKITYDQFVDLCILLGCDYCSTIPGIGMERSYALLKEYGSIDKMLNMKSVTLGKKTVNIPDEFRKRYKYAKSYFMNPPVKKDVENMLIWKEPRYEQLHKILKEKYSYKNKMLNNLLLKPLFGCHYGNIVNKSYKDIDKKKIINNREYVDGFINSSDDDDGPEIIDIDQDEIGVKEVLGVAPNSVVRKL